MIEGADAPAHSAVWSRYNRNHQTSWKEPKRQPKQLPSGRLAVDSRPVDRHVKEGLSASPLRPEVCYVPEQGATDEVITPWVEMQRNRVPVVAGVTDPRSICNPTVRIESFAPVDPVGGLRLCHEPGEPDATQTYSTPVESTMIVPPFHVPVLGEPTTDCGTMRNAFPTVRDPSVVRLPAAVR
jgi:hypothetical protein